MNLEMPEAMAAVEIQAACRDAGTQWMVVVCLASYFMTFLFLEWRLFQPQKNTANTKGKTPSPPSVFRSPTSISAFLAFFRGIISNPVFWLVGLVGLVLLRYVFAYETAVRSLQPLVLLAGIVFGKGIALWARSLKSKVQGLKLEGDASSGCATFSPSEAEKGIEVERVSAPSAINHQLSTFNFQPDASYPRHFSFAARGRFTVAAGVWNGFSVSRPAAVDWRVG